MVVGALPVHGDEDVSALIRLLHPGMKSLVLALSLSLSLLGCAAGIEPALPSAPLAGFDLVDPERVDADKFREDYAACAALGNQNLVDFKRTAANAVNSAADKASLGVLGGRAGKHADRVTVLKRCLAGRGYTVIR